MGWAQTQARAHRHLAGRQVLTRCGRWAGGCCTLAPPPLKPSQPPATLPPPRVLLLLLPPTLSSLASMVPGGMAGGWG